MKKQIRTWFLFLSFFFCLMLVFFQLLVNILAQSFNLHSGWGFFYSRILFAFFIYKMPHAFFGFLTILNHNAISPSGSTMDRRRLIYKHSNLSHLLGKLIHSFPHTTCSGRRTFPLVYRVPPKATTVNNAIKAMLELVSFQTFLPLGLCYYFDLFI